MRSSFSFIYHNHLVIDGNLDDNLDEKKIIPPDVGGSRKQLCDHGAAEQN